MFSKLWHSNGPLWEWWREYMSRPLSAVPFLSFNDPWATFSDYGFWKSSGQLRTHILPWAWLNNVISIHTPPTLPTPPQTLLFTCSFFNVYSYCEWASPAHGTRFKPHERVHRSNSALKTSRSPRGPPWDKLSHQLLTSLSKKWKRTEIRN